MTRDEALEAVKGLGKFEGEEPYVPYYYDAMLDGAADYDDGDTFGFKVTPEDKALFPELKGRRVVRLFERSDGFVCEVR
jgi:hypothetical protein